MKISPSWPPASKLKASSSPWPFKRLMILIAFACLLGVAGILLLLWLVYGLFQSLSFPLILVI